MIKHILCLTLLHFYHCNANSYLYVDSIDNIPDVGWSSRLIETKSENDTFDWAAKLENLATPALRGCLIVKDKNIHLFSITNVLSDNGYSNDVSTKVKLKFTIESPNQNSFEFELNVRTGKTDATVVINDVDDKPFFATDCFLQLPGSVHCLDLRNMEPVKLNVDLSIALTTVGIDQCLPFILKVVFDKGNVVYLHQDWRSMAFTYELYDDDGVFRPPTTVKPKSKEVKPSLIVGYVVLGVVLFLVVAALIAIIVCVIVKKTKQKSVPPAPIKTEKKHSSITPIIQTIHISSQKPRKRPTNDNGVFHQPGTVVTIRPAKTPPAPPVDLKERQIQPSSTNLASDFLKPKVPPSSDTGLTSRGNPSVRDGTTGYSIKDDLPEPEKPDKNKKATSPANVKSQNDTLLKSASAIIPLKDTSKKEVKKDETKEKTTTTDEAKTIDKEGTKTKDDDETKDDNEEKTKPSEKSISKKSGREKTVKEQPSGSSVKEKSS